MHCAWDIGVSDATAIWFFQRLIGAVRLVGYYENSGEGLEHYLNKLDDMAAREWLAPWLPTSCLTIFACGSGPAARHESR